LTQYRIIRFYSPSDGRPNRVIKTVNSLEEAQAHTNDPRTRKEGVYFDGYMKIEEKRHYMKKEYGRIQAKHGFHGTVKRPTRILVAEGGKPEHVDVYASRNTHRTIGSKSIIGGSGIELPKFNANINMKIGKLNLKMPKIRF